jgi:hypothetical protein
LQVSIWLQSLPGPGISAWIPEGSASGIGRGLTGISKLVPLAMKQKVIQYENRKT